MKTRHIMCVWTFDCTPVLHFWMFSVFAACFKNVYFLALVYLLVSFSYMCNNLLPNSQFYQFHYVSAASRWLPILKVPWAVCYVLVFVPLWEIGTPVTWMWSSDRSKALKYWSVELCRSWLASQWPTEGCAELKRPHNREIAQAGPTSDR